MIRVLLADDHETVREGLRLLVDAQVDMEVVGEAGDGKTALDQVATLHPTVLVLDLTMPGMSGLSTARALKENAGGTAVVALTRHDDDAFVQELMTAGAAAYVLKQSSSATLLNAIRAAAAGGRFLDPALPPPEYPRDPRRRAETPPVTERETEVLRLMAIGHSNKDIAAALDISVKTVEVHKANAMRKLNLRGRTDVVRYAVMNEWLKDP
ncbi:MAG TPA: response regulator transcription factor [Vicinamibacterales bacterium]|nr:response regulator transcription factor [Vicinamibacterales bacterium]